MFPFSVLAWTSLAASPASGGVEAPVFLGVQPPDSVALHREARDLQGRFERHRVRDLPRTLAGGSRECDEVIGRLCIWDEADDEWDPRPEPPTIRRARNVLLTDLAALAEAIPGDHWLFGQRIRYLAEADRLEDAEVLAISCGLPDRWRCAAYLGFALHLQSRTVEAARAFERALAAMPDERAAEWTDPEPVLGGRLLEWAGEQPDSAGAVARLWELADPLLLAPGNDRWTGHLARWTYAMSFGNARNPHGMRWGRDLTQAAVRYGWSVAWEKGWPSGGSATSPVVGRDPPAAARTFPPRDVLVPSEDDSVLTWTLPPGHARSAYLSPHLDSLGALDGQIGRFWRRDHVLIVAAASVPVWPELDTPRRSARAGLFLIDGANGPVLDLRTTPDSTAAVRLAGGVPHTDWGFASLEVWDPDRRRAQRLRVGMSLRPVPPDLFALSDLVLVNAGGELANAGGAGEPTSEAGEPTSLATFATMEDVIGSLRVRPRAEGDDVLGVALEVYGLGYRAESVGFRAWVEDRNPSAFRRLARRLGLAGPAEKVSVQWHEAGPDRPGPFLRVFSVRLPGLDPGAYDVVVEVSAPGRMPLSRRRAFTVPSSR